MSLLNIGLQAVGIMREKQSDQFEAILKSANSTEDIRKIATKADNFKEEFISSLLPPIELIKSTFSGLELKGVPVKSLEAASEEDIERLFAKIITVDSSVQKSDTQKRDLSKRKKLQEYLDRHCVCRHYYFSIRKCGSTDCAICSVPRLPPEVFQQLSSFPDPMKATEKSEAYLPFESVYGQTTTEKFRPSQG